MSRAAADPRENRLSFPHSQDAARHTLAQPPLPRVQRSRQLIRITHSTEKTDTLRILRNEPSVSSRSVLMQFPRDPMGYRWYIRDPLPVISFIFPSGFLFFTPFPSVHDAVNQATWDVRYIKYQASRENYYNALFLYANKAINYRME